MARHMQETFQEIARTAGGEVIQSAGPGKERGISRGGECIHELGGTRIGNDPRTSVLNSYCQAWDCKNLLVTDGAPFVSNADKNPTLTVMALAWRTFELSRTRYARRTFDDQQVSLGRGVVEQEKALGFDRRFERRNIRELLTARAVGALFSGAQRTTAAPKEIATKRASQGARVLYQSKIFHPHEWKTVRVLCDLIIPADERSVSATAAGVPEFIDARMLLPWPGAGSTVVRKTGSVRHASGNRPAGTSNGELREHLWLGAPRD
jgi:hypothetical protein